MKYLFALFSFTLSFAVFSQYDFKPLEAELQAKKGVLGGKLCMLIYKGGKIVYEKDMGYSRNTQLPIASCSKWLTAAMLMTFVEEGKISLEDTIGKFLPVFTKNKKGKIRIRHCLSHTTGIQGEEISLQSLMSRNKYHSLEEEVNAFALRPVTAKPGDQFFYGNIGLNIVGRIMEVVAKKDFETLFQEKLGKPLQMNNTTFVNQHAVNPSGGALSTPHDYMNFLTMILEGGKFNGAQILRPESLQVMQQSHTDNVKVSYSPDQAEGLEYGFGEWILEQDDDEASTVVSSPGLFGTFPYVDLEREYAAILFVKTLKFKDRKATYKAIKTAADKSLGL